MKDSKHSRSRNITVLSKYAWKLKDANISPVVSRSIVTKMLPKTQLDFRKLYPFENFYIIKSFDDPDLFNKNLTWLMLVVIKVNYY